MSENARTVVITGASSGIGAVAAQHFAEQGDRVVVVGRNPERTKAVAERIGAEHLLADYARLDDVRALATTILDRHERVDVLLNNAGGLVSQRTITADGHDLTIQSNHLAPYLLTRLLLPALERSAQAGGTARVVSTASAANLVGHLDLSDLDGSRKRWNGGWRAYGTSKLAVILSIRELARRAAADGTGVEAYSVHPGAVVTGFGRSSALIRIGTTLTGGRWGVTAEVGAAPLIALASPTPVPAASGAYFDRMRPNGRIARQAHDEQLQRGLWAESARLTGLPEDDSPATDPHDPAAEGTGQAGK